MKIIFLLLPFLLAMTDAEFITELKQYDPLPKPVHSWPWKQMKPDVAKELARVFRSASIRLGNSKEAYNRILAADPEYVAINFGPFHSNGMIDSPKWTKDEWNITDYKTIQYFAQVNTKFTEAANWIGNRKVIILFDHENWPETPTVTIKLNMLVLMAKENFPNAEIHFYNFNQYRLDKRVSPVGEDVISDTAGVSLYYNPMSWENITRLNSTCEYNDEVIAWVAIGCQWELPFKKREWCNTCAPNLTHTQRLAYNLKQRRKIKAIAMWPEVGDPEVSEQREHILAFIKGMNDG